MIRAVPISSSGAAAGDDDEEEEGEVAASSGDEADAAAAPGGARRFRGFHQRTVKGTLFKLNPVRSEDMALVEKYLRSGTMQKDRKYALTVHAVVSEAQGPNRDISHFWESPWVEDQVQNVGRKRRIDEQQRNLAINAYIRAQSSQDPESANQYIANVTSMMEWEQKKDAREQIKAVSVHVQSTERECVQMLLQHPVFQGSAAARLGVAWAHLSRLKQRADPDVGVVDTIAHSLRRAPSCYDAFARMVGGEMLLSRATGGSYNTTIALGKNMILRGADRGLSLLQVLNGLAPSAVPLDTFGMPLALMKTSLCVCNDVLVVQDDGSASATYVLSIEGQGGGPLDLTNVDTVKIAAVFTEDEYNEVQRKQASGLDDLHSKAAAAAAGGAKKKKKAAGGAAVVPLSAIMQPR